MSGRSFCITEIDGASGEAEIQRMEAVVVGSTSRGVVISFEHVHAWMITTINATLPAFKKLEPIGDTIGKL